MVFMLESTSVAIAAVGADALKQSLALPNDAFSYLYSHGALDVKHLDFLKNTMDRINDGNDQAAIIEVAESSFRLFADVMRSIPVSYNTSGVVGHAA